MFRRRFTFLPVRRLCGVAIASFLIICVVTVTRSTIGDTTIRVNDVPDAGLNILIHKKRSIQESAFNSESSTVQPVNLTNYARTRASALMPLEISRRKIVVPHSSPSKQGFRHMRLKAAASTPMRLTRLHYEPHLVELANKHFHGGIYSEAFKYYAKTCAENKTVHTPSYLKFPMLIEEPNVCLGAVFLIIAVHSSAGNFDRRQLIRHTWASIRQIKSHRIKTVFFLGNTADAKLRRQVQDESNAYHDIVLRDFVDHYRNMSYKHLTVMQWVAERCAHAKYILKVDDDTFVNTYHLIQFLGHNQLDHFYCKRIAGMPIRQGRGGMQKWRVTYAEYPYKSYPAYCEGFAYLMPATYASKLFWCSAFRRVFWIDDVYVTGVLAQQMQMWQESFWTGFHYANFLPSFASERIMDVLFLLASHNEVMNEYWYKIWKSVLMHGIV